MTWLCGRENFVALRVQEKLFPLPEPKVWRRAELLPKPLPTLLRFLGGVEHFHQLQEAALQIGDTHVFWLNVNVEKRAEVPRWIANNPAFRLEPMVQRRAGERGQKGDLHFVKA